MIVQLRAVFCPSVLCLSFLCEAFSESNDLLASEQCGFRKNRSTADHLVRFDSCICNAFAKKEHVPAIFFDLEKAYDTTWKHGILSDLYDLDF